MRALAKTKHENSGADIDGIRYLLAVSLYAPLKSCKHKDHARSTVVGRSPIGQHFSEISENQNVRQLCLRAGGSSRHEYRIFSRIST